MDDVRLDKYLWAVRIFKTRSDAAEAIRTNRVTVGGATCKPSREVRIGDVIAVKRMPVVYQYKVLDLVSSRQPAKNVPAYCLNITPQEELDKLDAPRETIFVFRDRGTGRPTKKERRELDSLMDNIALRGGVADATRTTLRDPRRGRTAQMQYAPLVDVDGPPRKRGGAQLAAGAHGVAGGRRVPRRGLRPRGAHVSGARPGRSLTGDIPAFEKRRQDETHEAALLARWVETLPEPLRAEWRSLYAEMEALATPEARLYKALDKLEAVIQHNEADIATWQPLEYDSTSPTVPTRWRGTATCDGSKRPPTKSAGRKSPRRVVRRPTMRGNSRGYPTGCAALCTAVCRVSAKVVRFGRPSACTNVLRNHSEPFLWRFLQAASLHLLMPKGGTKSIRQAKPPGTDRRLCLKTLRGQARARVFDGALTVVLFPAFSQGGVRGALSRNRDY